MTATRAVECGELAAALRELRERTGLSLAALAARTPYSKSSWERYLNGKKPVPRQAVQALCVLVGEPGDRLLALWELADAAWSGRSAPAPDAAAAPAPEVPAVPAPEVPAVAARGAPAVLSAPPVRAVVRRRATVLLLCAGAVMTAVVFAARAAQDSGVAVRRPPSVEPSVPRLPGCSGAGCEGRDPVRMACGGSGMVITAGSLVAVGGQRLQIRYAKSCGAAWVRATGLRHGDTVELTLPGGRVQRVVAGPRDSAGYRATPMAATDDPTVARACLTAGSGGRRECLLGSDAR